MNRRALKLRRAPHTRLFAASCLVLFCCFGADASTLDDYRGRVLKATNAVEEFYWTVFEEETDARELAALESKTLRDVRDALPPTERVEWSGGAFDVDNKWLHDELDLYEKLPADKTGEREDALYRVSERLRSLVARLDEAANAPKAARDKEAEKGRLNAILRRPEYNEQAAEDTALSRLWKSFRSFLRRLMPRSQPLSPGAAGAFSAVARVFVFALAAGVIIFVLWKYGASLLPRNRAKKKTETEARVVLGERLAPDQTAADLVAQAEALARAGDLRGAIRKAYIAVLFELGERKILRLAAHKTNRDYLSAVRATRDALYADMQPLTNNYERHWYGFAPATDADWDDFRSRCRQLTQ
ncbi:MAG TPA: DUF4129 domain-containing protein [Pyrinomonadaceae bacterium]|nr:DUF4129 domain-containing protein [Pyrinomonadaceae bacterium]